MSISVLATFDPIFASTVFFSADLNGKQANAGAGTGGRGMGSANMNLDIESNVFSWQVDWSGPRGTASAAHFHEPVSPTENAAVHIPINIGSKPSSGSSILTADQITNFFDGLCYINIHNDIASRRDSRPC